MSEYGTCRFCEQRQAIHKYKGFAICFKCVQGPYQFISQFAVKVECIVVKENQAEVMV